MHSENSTLTQNPLQNQIDLPLLIQHAHVWAERYPAISRIYFYRGTDPEKPYVLLVEAPAFKKEDPFYPEYMKFRNAWFELPGSLFFDHDLAKEIQSVNLSNDSGEDFIEKWWPLAEKPDEESFDKIVLLDSKRVPFEKALERKNSKIEIAPSHVNNDNDFPELNLNRLQGFAKTRWLKKLSNFPVESIILYNYCSETTDDRHIIYAVVIEANPKIKDSEDLLSDFKIFQGEMAFQVEEPDDDYGYVESYYLDRLGINKTFENTVYNNPPNDDYIKEWTFLPKITDEPMPENVSEPHVDLVKYLGHVPN